MMRGQALLSVFENRAPAARQGGRVNLKIGVRFRGERHYE